MDVYTQAHTHSHSHSHLHLKLHLHRTKIGQNEITQGNLSTQGKLLYHQEIHHSLLLSGA